MAKVYVQNTTGMELTLKLLLQNKHEEALLNNQGQRYTSVQATVAFLEINNYIFKDSKLSETKGFEGLCVNGYGSLKLKITLPFHPLHYFWATH